MAITNTAERYQIYGKKTYAWPNDAQFYLSSNALADNQKRLADSYQSKTDNLAELLIDLILADFDFSQLEKLSQERLNITAEKAAAFADDFIIYILLPLDPHYPELKIKAEAERRKIDLAKFEPFVEAFNGELENELLNAIDKAADLYATADPKEEADAVLGIIKNGFADLLKDGSREAIESLNNSLLFILNNDIKNRDKILQLLTDSKAKLTEKSLLIHDKPEDPTIANWLIDFLFRAQNKIADSLVLSEYMTGSVNCRRLEAKERNAVQNLFTFYRNLKLYPEIFKDAELQDWQIFPLPEEKEAPKPVKTTSKPQPEADILSEAGIGFLADKLKSYDWNTISGLERRAILEELGVSKSDFDKFMKSVK